MDKLLELIQKKINELSATDVDYSKRDYLEDFLNVYNASDPTTYCKINNASYLLSLILSSYDEFNIKELSDLLKPVEYFLNNATYEDENDVTFETYLKILKALNIKEIIVKNNNCLIENKPSDKQDVTLYKAYKKLRKQIFDYVGEKEKKSCFHSDVANCFDILFLTVPDVDLFSAIPAADYLSWMCQDAIKQVSDDLREDCIGSAEDDGLYFDRGLNKILDRTIDKSISEVKSRVAEIGEENGGITSKYNRIKIKYNQENARIKKEVKDVNKKLRKLDNLFEYVLHTRNGELNINAEVLDMLFDDEVKVAFFTYAIEKNLLTQLAIEDINKELSRDSISKFELIFSEFRFNFNAFDNLTKQKIVEVQSEDDVRKILEFLTTPELKFITEYHKEFAKVLCNSNVDFVKFIYNLLKRNIIDRNFLIKHIDIIYNKDSFEVLYKNINYLDSIGVNLFNLGKSNPEKLLIDNNDIVVQTNILDEYGFKLDNKELYNFNVLDDVSLLDTIDNFIELGYGDIVLNNPKYLNEKSNYIVKRALISKLIGMSPVNSANRFIGAVSTGNGFYIKESDYDNYIMDYKEDYLNDECVNLLEGSKRNVISNSTKCRTIIKLMDELYMTDHLTYVIAGTKISRKRVKRNLEVLLNSELIDSFDIKELTYQSILYNMIPNVEPDVLDQIYNSIMNLQISDDKVYTIKSIN